MIEVLILASVPAEPAAIYQDQERPEIVVTGERVSRTIKETASSAVVQDREAIDELASPDRVEQLLSHIPNIQLGSGGEGPSIRGQDSTGVVRDLPAFLSGSRPRVTIRVDGRTLTYYELAFGMNSIWDVERFEVFRSPQSTSQGRNSIGGAIHVETNEPTFDWQGRARVVAGNYDKRHTSGLISGPLLDDTIAFRISGDWQRSRTSSEIVSAVVGIDPNIDEFYFVRAKMLVEPSSLPETRIGLTYSHGFSRMPQIEGIKQPFEDRLDPNAIYGIFEISVDSLTSEISYQPSDGLELRVISSFGVADVQRYAPEGLGEAAIYSRDFSVEPVITWRSSDGLTLTGGTNFTRSSLEQIINLAAFPLVRGAGVFSDTQISLGLFGEVSYPLDTSFTLIAGLRYQYDGQVRLGALTGNVLSLPVEYDRTFTAWLPKVSLAWDVTSELRVGSMIQRASNPGGININAAIGQVETFDAEYLWDFEIFGRLQLIDNSLAASANVFRYELTDAQRPTAIPVVLPGGQVTTIASVGNAPRAWSMGGEFAVDWRPSRRLQIRGAIGILDTRTTETIDPTDLTLGKRFQRSPHFSGSGSLVWAPSEHFTLSAQVRHNSSYFSDDLETAARRIDGSTTLDARASWTWGGITAFGYVRNLLDEFYLTYRFADLMSATAGDPREVGAGIEARF
ncbi:TonB-dependent receptor [Erythrobacter alti]|uniref:TonB-dependent receptor n=1 Tax=Erythrobacter alti TaxID=1896145 RepID=UPI0030F44826